MNRLCASGHYSRTVSRQLRMLGTYCGIALGLAALLALIIRW